MGHPVQRQQLPREADGRLPAFALASARNTPPATQIQLSVRALHGRHFLGGASGLEGEARP